MIIINDRPPLWDLIDAKFHVADKPILFAWGSRIYNPMGIKVPKELHAHEEIHGARQLTTLHPDVTSSDGAIEYWWQQYIASPEFRLAEEIPAHRAEYLSFCKRHGDHNTRNKALLVIAMKLAAPLYGSLVTPPVARDLILRRDK
jgi:hypothetical protein